MKKRELVRLRDVAQSWVTDTHAESTVRDYASASELWKKWAREHEFVAIPASVVSVALCFKHLLEQSRTPSPVHTAAAAAAIEWA